MTQAFHFLDLLAQQVLPLQLQGQPVRLDPQALQVLQAALQDLPDQQALVQQAQLVQQARLARQALPQQLPALLVQQDLAVDQQDQQGQQGRQVQQ